MVGEAQQQSQTMVSQSEVVRLASAQAHEIVASAEQRGARAAPRAPTSTPTAS